MLSFIITFILAILAYDSSSTQRLSSSPVVLQEINNKDPSPICHICSECGRLYSSNRNEDVKIIDQMNTSNNQNVSPVNNQRLQPQQPSNYSGSIFEEVKLEEYSPNPSMNNRNYDGLNQEQKAVLDGIPQFSDRWAFYPEDKAIVIPSDIDRPLLNENTDIENIKDKEVKEDKSSSDGKSTNGNKSDKKPVSRNKKISKNSSLNLMNSSIIIFIGLMIGISLIN